MHLALPTIPLVLPTIALVSPGRVGPVRYELITLLLFYRRSLGVPTSRSITYDISHAFMDFMRFQSFPVVCSCEGLAGRR